MKTYCFDLDGTLCTNTEGDYENSTPFVERINVVNKLYNDGNTILIDTARGSTTKIDWYDVTKKQLDLWGVKYSKLRVGIKLNADIFIDDKGICDKLFFK
jgi:hypothetical protein